MRNYLKNIDKTYLKIIREIGRKADKFGVSAYIVGGIVRDILLNKENLDLDIVVEADGIKFAREVSKTIKSKIVCYNQFGTASIILPNKIRIDFASARKESYLKSGALPCVRSGALKDDLFRRDFTINSMAISINSNTFGEMVDYFEGYNDLRKKKIRILHEKSFKDDPTRILRAVRFQERLNFKLEKKTSVLLKQALKRKYFNAVKPQRYFNEFKKILLEENPLRSLSTLKSLKALSFIDTKLKPNLSNVKKIHNGIKGLKKKFDFDNIWILYFVALVEPSENSMLKDILKKFCFSKIDRNVISQSHRAGFLIKAISLKGKKRSDVYKILKPLKFNSILYLRLKTNKKDVNKRIEQFLTKDLSVNIKLNGRDLKRIGF